MQRAISFIQDLLCGSTQHDGAGLSQRHSCTHKNTPMWASSFSHNSTPPVHTNHSNVGIRLQLQLHTWATNSMQQYNSYQAWHFFSTKLHIIFTLWLYFSTKSQTSLHPLTPSWPLAKISTRHKQISYMRTDANLQHSNLSQDQTKSSSLGRACKWARGRRCSTTILSRLLLICYLRIWWACPPQSWLPQSGHTDPVLSSQDSQR